MRSSDDISETGRIGINFDTNVVGCGIAGSSGFVMNSFFATLLVNPAGADNSVLYTAHRAGYGGRSISVTYATPQAQTKATVCVDGNAVTVTPSTEERMVISGATTPGVNGPLIYAGTYGGKRRWTSNGDGTNLGGYRGFDFVVLANIGGFWQVVLTLADGSTGYSSHVYSSASSPAGLTFATPATGSGTPTVTAGVSSAAQVIRAVNNSQAANQLIHAQDFEITSGPVTEMPEAFLDTGMTYTADLPSDAYTYGQAIYLNIPGDPFQAAA